jgi:hypothetical protein
MYVLVQHTVSDPEAFWNAADPTALPSAFKLHHTFPTRDGSHAACLWEAESVSALRDFIEPVFGRYSRNEYFVVENREGVAMPSGIQRVARARA